MLLNKRHLEELPDALTARDISVFLNLGYAKSLKLIRYGGLPHLRIGNTYRISKKNFVEWLNGTETKIINLD